MYYTIRTLVPDIFQKGKLKLENIQKVFDDWYVFYFPMLVNDVHRVYYMKAKRPNIVEPVSITAVLFALYEIRLHEDFMVDDIVVVDMGNHTFRDVQQMTPTYMSNCHAIYKVLIKSRRNSFSLIKIPAESVFSQTEENCLSQLSVLHFYSCRTFEKRTDTEVV